MPRYYSVFLAISDDPSQGTTEGKWVITAGPQERTAFLGSHSGPERVRSWSSRFGLECTGRFLDHCAQWED